MDGSHDYQVVKKDVENCILNLSENGLLIMDDSSLYIGDLLDRPQRGFLGHEGPSRVAKELVDGNKMKLIYSVGHNNIFQKIETKCNYKF